MWMLTTARREPEGGFNAERGFKGETMLTNHASVTRQELENSWRLRLEGAQVRYREANEQHKKLLQKQPEGKRRNPNSVLDLAHRAESQALAEYARVLRLFTDFTVNGKLPEELVAGSQGV